MCSIPKQSATANLLRKAELIIWDEAPMAKRFAIETLDRTLKDIMNNNVSFGGKVIVFGGDFRQVLPVVPKGTKEETINTSLVSSYLWPKMEKIKLTRNMRARSDHGFSEFLLQVGNGDEPADNEDNIVIPKKKWLSNTKTMKLLNKNLFIVSSPCYKQTHTRQTTSQSEQY